MSRIEAVLDHGFQRCFGRPRLTDEEVKQLIWKGISMKLKSNDIMELDRWVLNLSSIHVLVNMHDWLHRSCFKSTDNSCRYKIPQIPVYQTSANPIFSNTKPTHEQDNTLALNIAHKQETMQLVIDLRIFLRNFNSIILRVAMDKHLVVPARATARVISTFSFWKTVMECLV